MLNLLLASLLLHPVHETVAEIEWNPQSKRLEVALRLDVLDEQWLRKRNRRGESDGMKWASRYLRQHFRIAALPKEAQRDSTDYHWVGREEEGSHVWWFFEIEPGDQKRPEWIEQRMLLEREENYTHQILILDQVPRRSLTLTIQRTKANLDQAVHESNKINPTANPPADRRSRFDRRRDD